MPSPFMVRDEVWEGDDLAWTLAQIVGKDSELLQIVDVQAVAVSVYDKTDGSLLYTSTRGPIGVFTDVPVKDDTWTIDPIGYNFSHYLEHDVVFALVPMEGMHVYRTEYVILTTPTNGSGELRVVRETLCKPSFTT